MCCISELDSRPGRGVRIDEDLAEVAKSEDEHAQHAASRKTLIDKSRRGCEEESRERSEN
jgi:hypothetical protein